MEGKVILSYLLIATSLALMGVVVATGTRFAPLMIAWALCCNILAVEMAKGWPTYFDPPRQGIIYGAFLGKYVVTSAGLESPIRLHRFDYSPAIEGMLKDGPKAYDMDAKQEEGTGGIPGERIPGKGFDPNDLTSLEEGYGTK
jgi:hypothetical protein